MRESWVCKTQKPGANPSFWSNRALQEGLSESAGLVIGDRRPTYSDFPSVDTNGFDFHSYYPPLEQVDGDTAHSGAAIRLWERASILLLTLIIALGIPQIDAELIQANHATH